MAVIEHDGLQIDYLDAGRGPPVLLVHSSVCGNRQWRKLIERLSPNYRVIAPNLRGHDERTGEAAREPTTHGGWHHCLVITISR